jgi:Family of unknown function (DUF5994)
MTAPNHSDAQPDRLPLRLRMTELPRTHPLDGGWWPQSRDLTIELADLVDNFPDGMGRIVRATFSPPDWDGQPRRVPIARGYVQTGFAPNDDSHVMMLRTSERMELCLLVVPPGMSDAQGEEALTAAVTPGYAPSPGKILDLVRERVGDDRERKEEED